MRPTSHLSSLRSSCAATNAKKSRSTPTDAERRLWYYLRGNRLLGLKFRRQVPIGNFIADFLCEGARLVMEVDGDQHAQAAAYDSARTRWLNEAGYRVIRFANADVMENIDGVLEVIAKEAQEVKTTAAR